MSEIQRWDCYAAPTITTSSGFRKSDTGYWCAYEQHVVKVKELLDEIAQLKAERDEAYTILDNLWRATKGIDPVTGKAWLTPKMEIEAKKTEVVWNEERGEK